jgi:glycosyltransferase involved in cell wall biosynthesis
VKSIAYLTSEYARAGDTFIRREVDELRRLGFTVHTFSVRRSREQAISEEIRAAQATTDYLLEHSTARLVWALLQQFCKRPLAVLAAIRLAWKIRTPGLKAMLWHFAYLLEAAYLAQQLSAHAISHIHNHIAENSATVAMLAARISGIPFSMTVHGPHEFYVVSQIGLKEKIARSAFVACITSFCRSQCMAWCAPEDWYKLQIVRCGLDERFLGPAPTPVTAANRLVTVGRLCEEKGQTLLVEAIANVSQQGLNPQLTIIGDGPTRPHIERAIEKFNLHQSIHLAGWQSSDAVRDAIVNSTALVLPSFAEGLPVVIMEAFALGRPVISTYVAGIPELVQPERNGWLVPAGDVDGLAEAIVALLQTSLPTLTAMGMAGHQAVSERHAIHREVSRLANLIIHPPTSQ